MSKGQVKGKAGVAATSAERRQKAFEMRKTGAAYSQIGKALGISMQAAHQHVKKYLAELAKKTDEDAREVLQLELARLDQMLIGLYKNAESGKESAIDRVLRIMERRAKLLGLDSAEKREVSGPDGGPLPTRIVIDWGEEDERGE